MPCAPSSSKLSSSSRNTLSMYGWNSTNAHATSSSSSSNATSIHKKRSVSPSHHHKAKAPAPAAMPTPATTPRRQEENLYYEEDYADEIKQYMHSMDSQTLASAELMDMQPELQWFMRPYLIDFLVEVHQQFRLRPEVLYLAMNIVDRYVSKRVVYKKHYQLVGCAALWIAAKFEDGKDKVPLVRELADMCCKAYDESAFIQMEGHVLSTIGWCIGHPSAEAWLRIYTSGSDHEEAKVQSIARFLMEITLFHREFVGLQSSLVAHGALMLARFICNKARKPIGRGENVAVRIALAIDKHFADKLDSVSEIVIRKYAPTYYARASTVCREWYLSGRRFVYTTDAPTTPVSASGLPTPGLAPSGSGTWSKRGSWIGASPSSGSISCASSDAGDDQSPLTPITPVHAHVVDPFSLSTSASKENVPVYNAASTQMVKDASVLGNKMASQYANHLPLHHQQQQQRQVLHALPTVGELSIPNRSIRRLSN